MKAAIFDMDGTLLDSMPMWRSLGGRYLAKFGIELTPEIHEACKPMTLEQSADYFCRTLLPGKTPEQVLEEWGRMVEDSYRAEDPLKPYIREYLAALKERGVRLGVATLTPYVHAYPALRRHGLDSIFEFILTTDDVGVGKHDPAIYLEAARRLETPVSDCVVFEDAWYAVQTAKDAGFPVWAVADPDAAQNVEKIKAACDRYVSDYGELLSELAASC